MKRKDLHEYTNANSGISATDKTAKTKQRKNDLRVRGVWNKVI